MKPPLDKNFVLKIGSQKVERVLALNDHLLKDGGTASESAPVHPTTQVPSRDSDDSSSNSTPEIRHHRHAISSHPQGTFGGADSSSRNTPSQALDNPLYANLRNVSEVNTKNYSTLNCWHSPTIFDDGE